MIKGTSPTEKAQCFAVLVEVSMTNILICDIHHLPPFLFFTRELYILALTVTHFCFSVFHHLYCKFVIKSVWGFLYVITQCRNGHQGAQCFTLVMASLWA